MKGKKSSTTLTGRSWRLLRLALCWARKVVAFELLSPPDDDGIIRRGERELSFEEEETPIFRFKKETPPEVEKDMEEEEGRFERDWGEEEEYWADEERESSEVSEEEEEEEGIDSRAEEFIEWFHEQLKLQRLSNLQ
ncbi:hypothetical protein QJS04_geneDACA004535 [Acorus gramineus]|uniref:Uncharacterized protein n=1 Tax=Acorus gramineus TaxID=55184 RepID=A0AAV9BVA1_ACOGR|nr:hypothetical protein QJS04_geneDACA004535 [Acorus gramineus]